MEKGFFEDFVATCLVEMGQNQIGWEKSRLSMAKSAKKHGVAAEQWIFDVSIDADVLGANAIKIQTPYEYLLRRLIHAEDVYRTYPTSKNEIIAIHAYEDFHANLINQRNTYLSKQCAELMPKLINQAQIDRYNLKSQKLAVDAITACGKFAEADRQKCLETAAKAATPKPVQDSVPVSLTKEYMEKLRKIISTHNKSSKSKQK